jgi:hypothetical protein
LAPENWLELLAIAANSPFRVHCIPWPSQLGAAVLSHCWLIDQQVNPCLGSDWVLVLEDTVALLAVFTSNAVDLTTLAVEFVGHGLRFFMPLPATSLNAVDADAGEAYCKAQSSCVGQICPKNYQFTISDYHSHKRASCAFMITDQRVLRLALLGGGPVWRSAVELSNPGHVLRGPSSYAACNDLGICFECEGVSIFEDRMLTAEEGVLIGRSVVDIIEDKSAALPSYIPPTKTWWQSSLGVMGWTQQAEGVYAQWQTVYSRMDASGVTKQPPNASHWRDKIGHFNDTEKLYKQILQVDMCAFLSSNVLP